MKNLKNILAILAFLMATTVCYADSVQPKEFTGKNINSNVVVTPTRFSNQLKKTQSYNSPSYNSPAYSNYIQNNPALGAMMGGMMNSLNMGVNGTSYTPDMQIKQEQEYTRQQMNQTEEY